MDSTGYHFQVLKKSVLILSWNKTENFINDGVVSKYEQILAAIVWCCH